MKAVLHSKVEGDTEGDLRSTLAELPRQRKAAESPQRQLPQPAERKPAQPAVLKPAQPSDPREAPGQRWVERAWLSRLLRVIVVAAPVTLSLGVAAILSIRLPHARDIGTALLWWAVVVGVSTMVLIVADTLARRLLPLALLLRLSLLFPDQAPKRYRIAVRAWSTRQLRDWVDAAQTETPQSAPTAAAAQIVALLANLSMHDRGTRGHCERVRAYNDMLAEELGLPRADRDRLRWAALIHDIGKLEVPPRLLNKPGKPTRREWEVLRAHPLRGARIAAPLRSWLGPWADAIEQHHERWDGTGYPHGLTGAQISLGGRIVAVADAFEVMTSARPYSRPVSAAAARAELARCAGTHFDPEVVRAFLNLSLGRLRRVMGPLAWAGQVPFLAAMPRLEAAILGSGHAVAGAGAAAGVVAVAGLSTTSVPPHPHPHVHVAALPAAAAHPMSQQAAAPPAVSAPAPRAAERARTRHGAEAPASRARPHPSAPALAASAATAPGSSMPSAHGKPGGHGKAKQPNPALQADKHRRHATKKAHPVANVKPPRLITVADHGRCAGNAGIGLGNGGAKDGASHTVPASAARAHESAPGLRACE